MIVSTLLAVIVFLLAMAAIYWFRHWDAVRRIERQLGDVERAFRDLQKAVLGEREP